MNIATRNITEDEFNKILSLLKNGFTSLEGVNVKPNIRAYLVLLLEANLGFRVGDILEFRLTNFYKSVDEIRVKFYEQKTKKYRDVIVSDYIYQLVYTYAKDSGILETQRLFEVTTRAIQKQLQLVTKKLGMEEVSTHSFRKYFANNLLKENNNNLLLIQDALVHSSIEGTLRYVDVNKIIVDKALKKYVCLPNEKLAEINELADISGIKNNMRSQSSKLIRLEDSWFLDTQGFWTLRYLGFTYMVKYLGEMEHKSIYNITELSSLGIRDLLGLYTSEEAAKLGTLKYLRDNFLID